MDESGLGVRCEQLSSLSIDVYSLSTVEPVFSSVLV